MDREATSLCGSFQGNRQLAGPSRDQDRQVFALYGTEQIPETYIIDRQGVLRRKFVSAQNWTSPEITSYLSKL